MQNIQLYVKKKYANINNLAWSYSDFQLTISVFTYPEHVIDKPMTPDEIKEILYKNLYPHDPFQAVLQQELIINIGTFITSTPELFNGILKIRIGCVLR